MGNALRELARYGQSVWYDSLRRGILVSGELASGSRDYDYRDRESLRVEAMLERGDQAGLEALLASARA